MFVVFLQLPLLFDYYYFSVLDMVIHANVVSLSLPNWRLANLFFADFTRSSVLNHQQTPVNRANLVSSNQRNISSLFPIIRKTIIGLILCSILKQIKTGWFGKSNTAPRSSTPLFYSTLFGNRLQLSSQVRQMFTDYGSILREI